MPDFAARDTSGGLPSSSDRGKPMSQADATAFLERAEADEQFAADLESVKDDQKAVLAKVHAAGFDVSPDEILEAFTDRYGVELTPEQLDSVAAGADPGMIAGATVGAVVGVGAAVAVCAAFA
jgi:predicted ribosomally synthesized peptide with nif11-like leader